MALQLTYDYQLSADVIHHEAVVAHLKGVLNSFANKPQYSEFYIGITSDLEQRRRDHEAKKPNFRLMCVIYEEQAIAVANSFHNLERDAIDRFRMGIRHPDTGRVMLRCANGPGGSMAKNWLYVLIG